MIDTREKILETALKLFEKKGFNGATTKEIAKKADVAEITVFRCFTNKQQLFEESVETALKSFKKSELKFDSTVTFDVYFASIFAEKILFASKNKALLKMIIRETSYGTIPDHLQIIRVIQNETISQFQHYFDSHQITNEAEVYSDILLGLLLRFVVLEEMSYHRLSRTEQENFINRYTNTLKKP